MLNESKERVQNLKHLEIAYLVKGITNLKKFIKVEPSLAEEEAEFRKILLEHLNKDHDLVASFDPYSLSKLLRYLLTFNDSSPEAEEIFKSLSLLLV